MLPVHPSGDRSYVLTLSCPDRIGIVARITTFLAEAGGWIVEASYHSDSDTGWFFTRQVVRADSLSFGVQELRDRFAAVAAQLGGPAQWRITDTGQPRRAVLLVTKESHCLYDLLGRVDADELPVRISAVIGNRDVLEDLVTAHRVPFYQVRFPPAGDGPDSAERAAAFKQLAELVDEHEPDVIVLARFMQIMPAELCAAWWGRAINIHHSFLPSFVGARPYHQAHVRGVKLIGATCHYVTPELDAGPIIEQDVIRVDHRDTVTDMVRRGRDIERLVLARGLRWHLEDRVLVHGNKTVVLR